MQLPSPTGAQVLRKLTGKIFLRAMLRETSASLRNDSVSSFSNDVVTDLTRSHTPYDCAAKPGELFILSHYAGSISCPVILTPEFKLIAACMLRPPSAALQPWLDQLTALADAVNDWDEFLHLMRRHQLPSMTHDALRQLPTATVPMRIMETLQRAAHLSRMKSLRQIADTRRVLAAFEAAGITAVQLKGTALTQRLHGDPFLRDCSDIDVLVASDYFPNAARVLEELGAVAKDALPLSESFAHRLSRFAYHHGVFDMRATQTQVELHWRMQGWPTAFAARQVQLSASDAVTGERFLDPAIEMVDLVLHGAEHYWSVLKWLGDIRQAQMVYLPGGWEVIAGMAEELGAMHALRMTLLLTAWIYDDLGPQPEFELPPTAAARFAASYALQRMMAKRTTTKGPRAAIDRSAYRLLAATPFGRLTAAVRRVC